MLICYIFIHTWYRVKAQRMAEVSGAVSVSAIPDQHCGFLPRCKLSGLPSRHFALEQRNPGGFDLQGGKVHWVLSMTERWRGADWHDEVTLENVNISLLFLSKESQPRTTVNVQHSIFTAAVLPLSSSDDHVSQLLQLLDLLSDPDWDNVTAEVSQATVKLNLQCE